MPVDLPGRSAFSLHARLGYAGPPYARSQRASLA
ncbi:hypothetical protein QFZ36_000454 [Pseudarthrobacter siccitolerans]|uniref:Uncharacterized protein n=1 Tax=Pseudarthrobacter siccitolerans TaxID=861266 RepID=A0ABU0PG13_9MICC|nr:hypothetical protein [Pseudarthrobacter siccitolerans]MDQ0690866.1 hypothetical protein [Arthrobacter sp. W4I7]